MINDSGIERVTLRNLFFYGREKLKTAGIAEYENDAYELLFYAFGTDRSTYAFRMNEDLKCDSAAADYYSYIERRCGREPLQYITGKAYSFGYEFYVNNAVLIPRYDSEVLVDRAVNFLKSSFPKDRDISVLDMCSGSGCLLLSVLKETYPYFPKIKGKGCDISPDAIRVAEINAQKLDVRAEFVQSDLFENAGGKYDLIISNPPYIRPEVIEELEPEVRDFEPGIALDGGADGLDFYRKISGEAVYHLREKGTLIFEIGHDEGSAVNEIMKDNGFINIRTFKDLCGNDRVVMGERSDGFR